MAIWFYENIKLEDFVHLGKNTLGEQLGMEFTEIGEDYIKGTMPVDHRTKQPYGLLHGGASVALAETLGSIGSALVVDQSKFNCVGLEINANHLRSVRDGFVTGIAKPIHIGASTHVWDIRITDQRDKLVCISRLTVAVIKKPSA
ncbi:MAG: esterase [Chitinophagaceae bacterium BSSC1]|nr:MAG: esterase [Chitinophagaceae bacterium BSSC1]